MTERLLVKGKTKDLYDIGNGQYKLYFKDDMTGENGVFDPGANQVGLTVNGAGQAGLALSIYFFEMLNASGYNTHYISAALSQRTMVVKGATPLGTNGLEFVCRYVAMGSFIRRYGSIVEEGRALPAVVEVTIKSDIGGDPLINQDSLEALGVLNPGEYETLATLTKQTSNLIKNALATKGLELCDIKLEFGRDTSGKLMIIDEFSGGNMRVRNGNEYVPPLELAQLVTGS